jgi:hypothetical protein
MQILIHGICTVVYGDPGRTSYYTDQKYCNMATRSILSQIITYKTLSSTPATNVITFFWLVNTLLLPVSPPLEAVYLSDTCDLGLFVAATMR